MKKYVLALVMLLTTLCVIYAQNSNDEKWQEHKQKVAQKMDEKRVGDNYIENLSSIVNLSKDQEKALTKAYKAYYKTKMDVYKGTKSKHEDKLLIRTAHQTYKTEEKNTLDARQKDMLNAYYTTKREELQAKQVKRLAESLSSKNEGESSEKSEEQ